VKVWEFEIGVGVAANTEQEALDKLGPVMKELENIDYECDPSLESCGVMDETKEDDD
jgi:hypothetical protein